ncbi:MAG: hypothetical protein LAP39_08505 [Acidobacteriia bacterium]|nr:hypothetical protein [Terriglobia bacterium]
MNLKITRRRLAAAALGSSVALRAGQTPTAGPSEDLNTVAKEHLSEDSEALTKVELSMATEPAFQFKA